MDRFPPASTLALAHKAAKKHGTKLLLCFGGNARTNGYAEMALDKVIRKKFLKELIRFCKKYKLDGACRRVGHCTLFGTFPSLM